MILPDIENAINDLIVAQKEKDHIKIRAIEDYLYNSNITVERTESGINWRVLK